MTTPRPEIDPQATATTRARYDRVARIYDRMEGLMEWRSFRKWRSLVWEIVGSEAEKILEVGVGTGKNLPYYPHEVQVTAIDLSDQMLARARQRAAQLDLSIELLHMDAQALAFADESFDVVVSTFVFCSVPNPVLGLLEIKRVLRPGGCAVLLEHMRPRSPWLGKLFDLLNPLTVRLSGANINRRTVENIRKAGLEIESIKNLAAQGIVKLIIVRL